MELTARRLVGLTVGAYALLLVARPPRPSGRDYDSVSARRTPVERVDVTLSATYDTLRAIENALWTQTLRDSVAQVLGALPRDGRNRALLDRRIPPSLRGHIERVYVDTRARMPRGTLALPLFVVLDTSQGRWATATWLEDSTDGVPTCATVVRLRVNRNAMPDAPKLAHNIHRILGASFPQPRHFGLCAVEASFGAPSHEVREWLDSRDFRPVAGGYDPARGEPSPMPGMEFAVPWFNAADNGARALRVRACAAGRVESCLGVAAPPVRRLLADGAGAAMVDARFVAWGWNGSPDLINVLARSLGPERFGTLWRAAEPPPEAYRRITGVPIDTMARRLVLGDAPAIRVGASLRAADLLLAVLVAALFAGIAALTNPRGQQR